MNRSTSHVSGLNQGARDVDPAKGAPPPKQRKSSRIGSVLRKLLGRKSIKSQISLPTPTRQMEDGGPSDFITSATDPRYQRAVSLPVQVSRNSALGSHKPFSHISEEKDSTHIDRSEEQRPSRPRRASMPGTYSVTPEPMATRTLQEEDVYQQHLDEANIGYAVTSGSHPKRRSRSAGALHDTLKEHRMSPIQWRHLQRRSDEIRYWRDSIGPTDLVLPDTQTEQPYGPELEPDADRTVSADSVYRDAESEDRHSSGDDSDKENRQTFDFGVLAGNINEQEQIPIEERVMTVEVKLMDLEYAISKLQARSPSPLPKTSPSNLQPSNAQTPISNRATPLNAKSEQGSDSTTSNNTASTAATAPSLSTIPDHAQDPFASRPLDTSNANNGRPVSAATTLRLATTSSPLQDKQAGYYPNANSPPATSYNNYSYNNTSSTPSNKHNSITSLTIDHYATLINLIRREQAARIRLEDQVAELQRELFLFRAQTEAGLTAAELNDGTGSRGAGAAAAAAAAAAVVKRQPSQASFVARSQSGVGFHRHFSNGSNHNNNNNIGGGGGNRRREEQLRKMESFDDVSTTETETEEEGGYEDVYETPTEGRREWEGLAGKRGLVEGQVF